MKSVDHINFSRWKVLRYFCNVNPIRQLQMLLSMSWKRQTELNYEMKGSPDTHQMQLAEFVSLV